ncbi:MAG: UDP-glucose 4-epimerase GalE [Chlamydiia bacterium]|nr:UDP-glucose 4-epimerase GalE [Chlamydiia bacterium]
MSSNAVLVTGGAGYIGSHICKSLKESGYCPISLDNLSTGSEKRVQWGPFVKGDIFDTELIQGICNQYAPVALIHTAGVANVRASMKEADTYYNINTYGTHRLLEATKNSSIQARLFSSTCSVYGSPKSMPITEKTPTNPISPYGISKLLAEQFFLNYSRVGILRYFNVAGAEASLGECIEQSDRLIPKALHAMITKKPLTLYGNNHPTHDGTCIRDYIHPKDVASAHVSLLKLLLSNEENRILNLSTGKGYSLLETISHLKKTTGQNIETRYSSSVIGEPSILYASAEKAKDLLNWEPQHSDLETILKTAWEFTCSQS